MPRKHIKDMSTTLAPQHNPRRLLRKAEKVSLAYTYITKSAPHGSPYKRSLDEACVTFLSQIGSVASPITTTDVQQLTKTFESLTVLCQSLVAAGFVKGHLFAFVCDVGKGVLKDLHTTVARDEAQVPEASRLSTASEVSPAYAGVCAVLAHADGDADLGYLGTEDMGFSVPPSRVSTKELEMSEVSESSHHRPRVGGPTRSVLRRMSNPRTLSPRTSNLNTKDSNTKDLKTKDPQTNSAALRANEVLSFIRKTGTVGIPAVSQAFSQVSSKTVQRALASLVQEGKVTKTGDRRWTQYTAVDTV